MKNLELHFAAQDGDVNEIIRLVASGIDVNILDQHGSTPLKYASSETSLAAIRKLIELGADVNLTDDKGFSALHCTAGHGYYKENIEIARVLLDAGADINIQSKPPLSFVPLHEVRGLNMIKLLLSHGADPTILNGDGQVPEEYLLEEDYKEEANYIRSYRETKNITRS